MNPEELEKERARNDYLSIENEALQQQIKDLKSQALAVLDSYDSYKKIQVSKKSLKTADAYDRAVKDFLSKLKTLESLVR